MGCSSIHRLTRKRKKLTSQISIGIKLPLATRYSQPKSNALLNQSNSTDALKITTSAEDQVAMFRQSKIVRQL
jgi:hypothetical protein